MKANASVKMKMFFSMFKIGCIGFGGGSALIPVIEKEVVTEQKLVSKAEYDKDVIVASITPGALPVEIATGLGKRAFGKRGMLLAAICMAFPGALLTVLFLSILSGLNDAVIMQIEFFAIGIAAFICCLLTGYISSVVKESKKESSRREIRTIVIILGGFILTCGKNVYHIFGISGTPFFSISTVHLLMLAFFVILYTRARFNKVNVLVSAVLSLVFLACVGKRQFISNEYIKWGLEFLMLVLAVYGVRKSVKSSPKRKKNYFDSMPKETVIWLIFVTVLALPALWVTKDSLSYLFYGLVSSIMSFGGGDAYLTVADGMFVNTGYLSESEFYGHLVTVVNVLPGSILCKTLTGVGYYVGYHGNQNIIGGYIVALAGFAVSVAASGGVFCAVYCIYESFEKVSVFVTIRRWIRPIIAGLLLNVMLSLVSQSISVGQNFGFSVVFTLTIILIVYIINIFLFHEKKSNGVLIGVSVLLSLVLCNLQYYIL